MRPWHQPLPPTPSLKGRGRASRRGLARPPTQPPGRMENMPDRLLLRLAPFGFVLLWSSSFIGARVGLRHVTPLLFVEARLCLSAALLVLAMLVLRRSWAVLRGRWLHCAVAGVLVNTVLLDPAHVAMTRMNAAPIALIQTLNPLLTAVLRSEEHTSELQSLR